MKNRTFFIPLVLLTLLPCFSLPVHAQTPKDLSSEISAGVIPQSTDPSTIYGRLTNKSYNAYPCVRIEFILGTPYEPGREQKQLGTTTLDVENVLPRETRSFQKPLTIKAASGVKTVTECTSKRDTESVVLFTEPNFGGDQKSFGIGTHRLFNAQDFNDLTSSIRVPAGLVVIVYGDADEGGGYGNWVDFVEDQPSLTKYGLDKKISYLKVFKSRTADAVWVRNNNHAGTFEAGYFHVMGRGGSPPVYENPLAGPVLPPNIRQEPPRVPAVCTISGRIAPDFKASYVVELRLFREGASKESFLVRATTAGTYRFTNVPEGNYEVRAPRAPRGITNLTIVTDDDSDQRVTCKAGGSHIVNFHFNGID